MYKLYKITNKVNEKLYIGITKLSLSQRFAKHLKDSENPKYPLHCAISKYGKENFIIELLEENTDRKYISDKEQPTIEIFKSHIKDNGYNVAKGGYGGDLGAEANKKRKETRNLWNNKKKALVSLKLSNSRKGTKRSESIKNKMSENQKKAGGYGPKTHSLETKEKISASNSGKIRSEESKENYRKSASLRGTGPQLQGKKACCVCCKKEWDLGNLAQHLKRKNNESK